MVTAVLILLALLLCIEVIREWNEWRKIERNTPVYNPADCENEAYCTCGRCFMAPTFYRG